MAKDMIDLGTEYKLSEPCCATEAPSGKKESKTRIDYPTLYIRGKDLPELPDGEFYFIAKGKKVGYRDPINGDGEKSCEIAVLAMKPKMDEDNSIEGALEKKVRAKYKA
jgi:hypothetical protein